MNTDARHFDILVIGAGPAGLSAARTAAHGGASVGIVDDNPAPGGQIWRQGPLHPAAGAARALLDDLAGRSNVALYSATRIVQALGDRCLVAEDAQRSLTFTYGRLILACGARERFLPFPGWTLPGVTGAGGLQALIKSGMPVEGQRIVVAGSGPLLWAAAATAQAHGARVLAIVEQAPTQAIARFSGSLAFTPDKLVQALRLRFGLRKTPYWRGAWVEAAHGDAQLSGVAVRRAGASAELACDRLACGYGLVPNTGLAASLGCRLAAGADAVGEAIAVDAWQVTSAEHILAAGECTGVGGMELSAIEGRIAAHAALERPGPAQALFKARDRYRRFAANMHKAFALRGDLRALARPDTVFCRCEDAAYGDVAAHESWREAKLQTRCGMGPCQGKICGAAAAFCFGWGPQADPCGTPSRPPLSPVRISTLLEHDCAADPGRTA